MHEFIVNFADRRPDWSIWVTDNVIRKNPLKQHDLVSCKDAHGNSCGGFIERVDARTHLVLIALDHETYRSVTYG